jgi:hypothetical protein
MCDLGDSDYIRNGDRLLYTQYSPYLSYVYLFRGLLEPEHGKSSYSVLDFQ